MRAKVGAVETEIISMAPRNGVPLTFPSEEFSVPASLIVPEGAPRAENVPVEIILEFEDGVVGCPVVAYLDIINEGKPGKGKGR